MGYNPRCNSHGASARYPEQAEAAPRGVRLDNHELRCGRLRGADPPRCWEHMDGCWSRSGLRPNSTRLEGPCGPRSAAVWTRYCRQGVTTGAGVHRSAPAQGHTAEGAHRSRAPLATTNTCRGFWHHRPVWTVKALATEAPLSCSPGPFDQPDQTAPMGPRVFSGCTHHGSVWSELGVGQGTLITLSILTIDSEAIFLYTID